MEECWIARDSRTNSGASCGHAGTYPYANTGASYGHAGTYSDANASASYSHARTYPGAYTDTRA